MKFTVNQQDLNNALAEVSSAIDRRAILPILRNVLLVAENGKLTLSGTNLEVEKRSTIEANVTEAGSITVPASKLADFAKNADSSALVKLHLQDDSARISSGRSKWKLTTLPATDYPEFMSIQSAQSLSVDIEQLVDGIKRCSVAMANHDVRYYLNGMLFDISASELRLVATDGHRMMSYNIASDATFSRQVIVPRAAVLDILKMIGKAKDVSIEIGENNIKVSTDNSVMYTKLVDAKYPDYKRVIPQGNRIEVSANTEELKNAIKRVMPVFDADEKFKSIKLEIAQGEMRISGESKKQEKASEVLPVAINGGDMEIAFSGSYLNDAISSITSDNILLLLKDASSSARIDDGALTATVMPVRL